MRLHCSDHKKYLRMLVGNGGGKGARCARAAVNSPVVFHLLKVTGGELPQTKQIYPGRANPRR